MTKKILILPALAFLVLSIASCGGDSKAATDPKSIASKWCELNGKKHNAPEGAEKEAAQAALKTYEKEIESKYENDKDFMKKVEEEVEKCEDASEGR